MTPRETSTERSQRTRRSSQEVRSLILAAATELFAEKGFDGTTTREVAERAGVRETTMFRIYATKERLYDEAVLRPFSGFLETFTETWMNAEVPGGEPQEVLEQFVRELHSLVARNRTLIAALAWTQPLTEQGHASLAQLEKVGTAIAERFGLDFDVPVAVRAATIAVVATTMLEERLFPPEMRGDRLLTELTRMLVGATLHRPEDPTA